MRRSRILVVLTLACSVVIALLTLRSHISADDDLQVQAEPAGNVEIKEEKPASKRKESRDRKLHIRIGHKEANSDDDYTAEIAFHEECEFEAGLGIDENNICQFEGHAGLIDDGKVELSYEVQIRMDEKALLAKGNITLKINSSEPTILQVGDLAVQVWLK